MLTLPWVTNPSFLSKYSQTHEIYRKSNYICLQMSTISPNIHEVSFQEEGHIYQNELGEKYISATTLIGLYKKEFDGPYWSTYKSIKDVLSAKNQWDFYKIQAGGWEQVVDYWSQSPVHLDEVLDRTKYYLEMWRKEKEDAAEKGTKEHKVREDALLAQQRVYGSSKYTRDLIFEVGRDSIMKPNYNGNVVYAEARVWNDHYKIAGTVDKVEREGIYLDIKDYKTSKEIDKAGFRNEKMNHPLSEVLDCNFNHYQLQLSLYGWMLEQQGYKVRSLEIIHIRDGKKDLKYPAEYMPGWVERILHHYDKHREHQEDPEHNNAGLCTEQGSCTETSQ